MIPDGVVDPGRDCRGRYVQMESEAEWGRQLELREDIDEL